jgi:hypothetical protein
MVEFKGEGETDDAGSGDTDVGLLHGISLDGRGEVIVLCNGFAGRRNEPGSADGSDGDSRRFTGLH